MAVSRVGWALGLSAATFVALFAATGSAFSDREETPLSGQFQVTPSRAGDRATYALGMVVAEDREEGVWIDLGARMVVERFPDRVLFDRAGAPRPVQSFLTAWELDGVPLGRDFDFEDYDFTAVPGLEVADDDWLVAHPDAETGQVLALTVAPGSPRVAGRLAGDEFEDDADLSAAEATTILGTAPAPCGFMSPLQTGWDLSKPVAVPGECPPGAAVAGAPPPEGHRYLAFAHDKVQDWDATVFASTSDRDEIRLWFTPDVPYPVRMLVRFDVGRGFYDDSDQLYVLYEMSEFRAGQGKASGPAPAVPGPLAPRHTWGPDETAVDHPFPLSQALQAARDDPLHAGVRDFFARYPQAYVTEARYHADGDELSWSFTLAGGKEGRSVLVTHDASARETLVPVPLDGMSPTTTESDSAAGPFVPSGEAPAKMPSVAGALARWGVARDPSIPAAADPTWGHRIACMDEDCVTQETWVAVGTTDAATGRYSLLGLDANGGLAFLQEAPSPYPVPTQEHDEDWWDDYYGGGWEEYWEDDWNDDPRELTYSGGGFAFGAGKWTFPKAETTGTVGAAALLAGLVYLVWPLVKGGGALGLFSRIDRDDLLDHPLRADIVQIVTTQPGIHFQELVRRLDKGRGTMEHHLRKLVEGGVLVPQSSTGFTCYFPKGKVDRNVMAAAPVLKSDGARVVLQAIHDSPGIAAQDVALRTGLTPSTVNYHLKRITGAGLANGQRSGRFLVLTPTMLGQQALGAWGRIDAPAAAATASVPAA